MNLCQSTAGQIRNKSGDEIIKWLLNTVFTQKYNMSISFYLGPSKDESLFNLYFFLDNSLLSRVIT